MIVINFLDGEKINITKDTLLVGMNNSPRTQDEEFYLKKSYVGTLEGDITGQPAALATSDERLGIGGFLLSHDAFAIDEGEDKTIYFTSSIKSISVV